MTAATGDGRVDQPRLAYRPELDAIRGIAVLIVLFQHFGLTGVGPDNHRAGQVGVTLFFVLSGYLITSLLLVERRESGSIDLGRFYLRRFRRLFPALAFMVAVVTIAGLPGNPIPALTYTANVYQQVGFADSGAYQHTWTLAIEEQFYLVWPALFLVLARWPRAMVGVIVAIIVASVVILPWTGIVQRNDALMAGALLAIARSRAPGWVGVAGWIALLAMAFVPGDADATILTAAALASVAIVAAPGSVGRLRSMVRLGAISYAVYLWSYPIALVVQPVQVHVTPVDAVAWTMGGIAATITMAAISERWIERRWRVRGPHALAPSRFEAAAVHVPRNTNSPIVS